MLIAGCDRTSLARTTMFRLRPQGDMSFAAHLAEVAAVVHEVHDHRHDTSGSLAELGGGAFSPGTIVSLESAENSTFQIGLVSFTRSLPSAASAFDLALDAIEENATLTLRLGFAADLFEPATIERWADSFVALVTAITDDPDQKLGLYDILTAPERQLIDRFNATEASYPAGKTLIDLFEASAERHGDRVAVRSAATSLTYAELNRRADRLAAALAARARPGSAIGMFMERSEQAPVALLAILKARCFYVPVDPSYPAELVEHMLADSACQAVVTERHLIERLPAGSRHLALDAAAAGPVAALPRPRPDDVAYVIYTSGSTGRPKGCLVTHRNVVRLMVNDRHDFRFGPDDVWLCAHSLSFDFSVWELWGAFAYGGSVVIAERQQMRDPAALLALIRTHRVSVLNQTPAAFYGLIEAETRQARHDLAAHLRIVIFGGDRLEPAYLRPWTECYPPDQVALINMYGITETTVHVSYYRLTAADIAGGGARSLIGRPLPETTILVLNPQRLPQPVGVPGELWVGGSGVSLGYLNRPDLTQERFAEIGGKRLYRTGDVGRLRADGVLEYIGRNDHQVQIRGHRVELGSIEQALADHPAIRKALLIDRDGANGAKELVAYIVGDAGLTAAELRLHLAKTLPDYMIPSHFVSLDTLPLTANGKLDRAALPSPEQTRLPSGAGFVAPNTRLEAAIADIWRDVLALPAVGIEDDYFALGGDSMKALRILSRMQHAGMAVTLAQIVSAGTIARLAALIAGGPVEAPAPLIPGAIGADSPLVMAELGPATQVLDGPDKGTSWAAGPSPAMTQAVVPRVDRSVASAAAMTPIQHWLLGTHGTAPNHFNNAVLLAPSGRIDVAALQRTVAALVAHHDALRLSLDLAATPPRQRIAASVDVPVEVVDVDTEAALTEHAGSAQRSFDIARAPLLRVVLYRLPAAERLLIVCHHLTIDGVSWRILLEDLGAGYAAAVAGHDPAGALPAQSRPWHDWAGTLADATTSRELLAEVPYWASVEAASVPAVPTDFADPDNRMADHRTVGFELDWRPSPGTRRPVPDANTALLAAMATAFSACFGMDRLRIRLEGHGREEIAPGVDVSRTLGWFTTVFPLLVDLSGAATVSDAVARVSDALAGVPRKGIGYGILRYLTPTSLRPGLAFGNPPEIGFNYLGEFDSESAGGFRLADEPTGRLMGETLRRPELIDVETAIVGGRLTVAIGYGERLHKRATIERLAAAMEAALRTLMGDGGGPGASARSTVPASDSTAVAAVSRHLGVREDAIEAVLPVTPLQAGMLFHSLRGETQAYFVQFTYHLAGRLDLALFEATWQHLAQRHQALRTAIVMPPNGASGEGSGGAPVQAVLKQRPVPVRLEDLKHLAPAKQTPAVARIAAADRARGFDLARDALVRVTVVRLGPADVDVIWSSHHAILDGWSIGILQEEFAVIYAALVDGSDAGLAPPPPFARHLDWLAMQDQQAARRFWAENLASCPSARMLPGARPDGRTAPYALEEHAFLLDAATTRRLGALASRLEVTLNTLVQTLWGVLLGAALDTGDVAFGTVVSGRSGELDGIERMVGLFLRTIPVRITFSPADSFADVARRVQARAIESETFNHLPLAEIQALQGPRHTLFDHLLAFENYPISPKARVGGLQVSDVRAFEQGHYDYSVVIHPGERLDIKFSFNRNVLPREVFIRLEARLRDLIAAVLANPWQRFDGDAAALVRPPSGSVSPVAQAEDYPVSHAQRRLWVLAQMGGHPAAYTLPAAFRLDGKFERTVLISALEALPVRHEALRTVFTVVDDEPRQVVLTDAGFRVDCIDLSRRPDPIAAAHEQAEHHRLLRFDLATGPLIAARLLILGADSHVLLVNVHHIVADAWSVTVMVDEILRLVRGQTLPPLHSQYKDHAMRERENLLSGKADADRDWWHRQLAQLPERLDLPFDRPVPEMPSFNGDRVSVTLDEAAVAALRNLTQAVRGTLFTGLLALVADLLRRHTGQTEMILGIPVTARDGVELEQQVGFYVNTLLLRVSVGSGDSAGTLSARIMDAMLSALEHRAYPFDLLVDDLALPREGGRPPLFDVMAVFQDAGQRDLALDDVAVTPFGAAPKVGKFPLTFIFCETATGATLDLEYATDLFDRARIERMAGHFVRLLEGVVADGKAPLCALDCFGDAERRLLAGHGQPVELAADATAVSLFAEQVAAGPDRLAVIHRTTTLSYAELDARANDLAWALRMDNEVTRGDVVAVLLDRSDHLAVAFLGILKAGAVYLPVDPTYPAERIAFMLADSGARAIVTEPRHTTGPGGEPPHAASLGGELPHAAGLGGELPHAAGLSRRIVNIAALPAAAGRLDGVPERSDVAYLIYTSGSTGVPKGVLLEHRGAVNLALAQRHGLGIEAQHRVLQFAPSSFDASVWEMIMALLNGACLVIADAETVRDPVEFAGYLGRHAVTVATLPPVYLNELDDSAVASLHLLITAGEAPNPDRARRLARTLTYVNAYGPTETTVCATWHRVDPEADGPIPIGRAIANTEVVVLDADRRLCPIGVRGEIYIGGPGLARLYLGRPELTEAAFVAHPLRPGERLYRTGDQGVVLEDGAIHYAGRNDRQVKLRGHRIELAEVERIISRHPDVRDAVVGLRRPGESRRGGQSQLVAYVVPGGELTAGEQPVSKPPGGELTPARLQEDLARIMPAHMMPARFVMLDALPLLPNGKIDHSALPDPSDAVVTSGRIDDPLEAFVADAWRDVLHHGDFGRTDRFFEVGGDSIKAIQVISRLRREGHRIEMREFMAASSVAALASLLAEPVKQARPQSVSSTASLGAAELEGLFNDD
jgi:amino acid adenylation domain-containing protein/non-ribosomal peptide synthase protein (TIGR01720 family)